jgi:glutamyl-tRNA reductase
MLLVRLMLLDTPRRPFDTDVPGSIARFRTCLRDVIFLDGDEAGVPPPTERETLLENGDAYTRLVEIVCGLQSPLAGETQVQGQFKAFLDALEPRACGWLRGIGRQVLTDARVIRERHLRGLGSRTYGSAVRRHTRDCDHIALIGAGALAREIDPYVADTHTIDRWTRTELADPGATRGTSRTTALIVAAPVDSCTIARVAHRYPNLHWIIDLRADAERTAIDAAAPVVTLQDIFAGPGAGGPSGAPQVREARLMARQCGRRFDSREELHPFGWDDLCA